MFCHALTLALVRGGIFLMWHYEIFRVGNIFDLASLCRSAKVANLSMTAHASGSLRSSEGVFPN